MPKTLIDTSRAKIILKMWKKGLRAPEIAKNLDMKPQAIYQFLYRLRRGGYELDTRKAGRPNATRELLKK